GIEEGEVAVPGERSLGHLAALLAVGHKVHVSAGNEIDAAASRMDVDDDVGQWEENGGQVVGDHLSGRAVGLAGKGAVEVLAVEGRQACAGFGGGQVESGNEDEAAANLFGLQFAHQL